MHNEHGWKEKSENGEKREVRATKFGGVWRIQSKLKGAGDWTPHDPPLLADLVELRDVLFRKYQRRRAAYEDVILIEKLIAERTGE